MKRLVVGVVLVFWSVRLAEARPPDWRDVEKVFGREGAAVGDVFKITFPRSDLKVNVGGVRLEPGLASTSWMAFKQNGNHSMIMGDLVLLDREIAPVMAKLAENGLEVTALHNHLVGESPRIIYMHFSGQGNARRLAETMRAVLERTNTPLAPLQPQQFSAAVDWTKVESIFRRTGQHKGTLFQLSIPRAETITENGVDILPTMGVATAINFQMAGKGAVATGDFVLIANEVNPVLQTLTEHGIAVTAIHSHMLSEMPRLFFLHFWGTGDVAKLAQGLKLALERTSSPKSN